MAVAVDNGVLTESALPLQDLVRGALQGALDGSRACGVITLVFGFDHVTHHP
jgi:hypothetical protein